MDLLSVCEICVMRVRETEKESGRKERGRERAKIYMRELKGGGGKE